MWLEKRKLLFTYLASLYFGRWNACAHICRSQRSTLSSENHFSILLFFLDSLSLWNLELITLARLINLLEIFLSLCPQHREYMYIPPSTAFYMNSGPCYVGVLCKPFPFRTIYLNLYLPSFNSHFASAFSYYLMFAWLLGKTIGIFVEPYKTLASTHPKAMML